MPTIKDVARVAGCSTATVSRALATPDKVSPNTRQRVQAAIVEVGYAPNLAARNLRRSESRTIVVLLPDIANPFFSEIIAGLEETALQSGYQVLLGDCEHDSARAEAYFNLLRTNQADGLILLTAEVPRGLLDQTPQAPIVMACEYLDDGTLPTVRIDNHLAAMRAVAYLQSLGHQRIATLAGPAHNPICRDRIQGYREQMHKTGPDDLSDLVLHGDFSFRSGFQQGHWLLQQPEPLRPTAVFCHSDEMAIGLIKAVRAAGLTVPEDISVMGFDNIGLSAYCEPELTTISQPRDLIGRTAMATLLDQINNRPTLPLQLLQTQLIVRNSTAPPART